jgi:hypothetical protein
MRNFILPLIVLGIDIVVFLFFFFWPLERIGETFPVCFFIFLTHHFDQPEDPYWWTRFLLLLFAFTGVIIAAVGWIKTFFVRYRAKRITYM